MLTSSHTVRGFPRWWIGLALLAAAPNANAARLRIVAATELQLDPTIRPNGEVTLAVRARDDRGNPVRGHVRLTITTAGHAATNYEGDDDARGEVRFDLDLEPGTREFHASAELVGTSTAAGARAEADIDITVPFVTLDLQVVPPIVDVTAREIEADVTHHVAELVPANPLHWPVALYVGNEASPRVREVDQTGFAAFHIPLRELHGPGVVTMHAAYSRHGATEVRSPDRRVVLRAATRMTLARVPGDTPRVVGTLDTSEGPVERAPVRIVWGDRVVAAALTDAGGIFTVTIDPDIASQPGVALRAVFEPSEPWLLASQSSVLVFTAPEARRVSWRWALVPVGAAIALLVIVWLRRRRDETSGRVSIPVPALGDAAVERVGDARGARVRIVLHPEDRATHATISDATVVWRSPALGAKAANEVVETHAGTRFDCEVSAEGYAPRTLAGDLARAGEYHVRVPLRTWREELFERVRAWMRRAGAMGSPALPTPREVLANRTDDARAEALVTIVEEGAYGPDAPGPEVIARADAIAEELESRGQRER
jgi:hypothetical protein